MVSESSRTELSKKLYQAAKAAEPIDPITDTWPQLTIKEAYDIQQRLIALRLQDGEQIIGKKIGVTSHAVMQMLGVDQPDFGMLTDAMVCGSGDVIPAASMISPKAEGEIAFVLKHDLTGPGITSADVLRATEGVMACFEVVDSRIRDWKIRFQDTVADNASCGMFVLSSALVDPRQVDLITCGMVLEKNGEVVVTGAGAATMNSPVNAVVWLANTLGSLGIGLKAGEVILSGALGAMVPVMAGDNLRVTIGGIGSCSIRFS